ncbi:MAG: DUF177 domain-containing protein [Alphaproteobacteria bacterium]|nr:DUF177 domain-containing protein [Alphaproteobacteria bacterium]
MQENELSIIVRTDHLPNDGKVIKASATEQQRANLASRFGVISVESFDLEVTVKPITKHKIHVTGHVSGIVKQSCAVTLAEIENPVSDDFEVIYESVADDYVPLKEIDISPDEVETEDLIDNKIDVGELAVEYFSLSINPYARAEGAVFVDKIEPKEEDNPFSVLEKLKKS